MSQLTKSLEKRIQELTASIDAQKTELAAYERVLHMEVSKGSAPAEPVPAAEEASSVASHITEKASVSSEPEEEAPAPKPATVAFTGNKTAMVAEIVKSYGKAGANPKDVDAYFTAKNISRSKNLIYNTLSYLVSHGKLERREGKYFALSGAAPQAARKTGVPATKKTVTKTAAAPATTTKRRLSPEGLKRIKEALKKRWAAKRAEAESKAPTKTAAKKK